MLRIREITHLNCIEISPNRVLNHRLAAVYNHLLRKAAVISRKVFLNSVYIFVMSDNVPHFRPAVIQSKVMNLFNYFLMFSGVDAQLNVQNVDHHYG